MLCSDGLTEMVGTYEIAGLLSIGEDDMHESARRLVDLANEAGGRDNISVTLVRSLREGREPAQAEDDGETCEVSRLIGKPNCGLAEFLARREYELRGKKCLGWS